MALDPSREALDALRAELAAAKAEMAEHPSRESARRWSVALGAVVTEQKRLDLVNRALRANERGGWGGAR